MVRQQCFMTAVHREDDISPVLQQHTGLLDELPVLPKSASSAHGPLGRHSFLTMQ